MQKHNLALLLPFLNTKILKKFYIHQPVSTYQFKKIKPTLDINLAMSIILDSGHIRNYLNTSNLLLNEVDKLDNIKNIMTRIKKEGYS